MHNLPEIQERIAHLAQKYQASGQELVDFLDGLLHADYLTYWNYAQLDTLLSLQNPRTSFKDELIFIVYHQITELYFKLSLHEMEQIVESPSVDIGWYESRMERINMYFSALTQSFGIMEKGMEREQFLKFRMSLIPASGFQSAQYRKIEILATDFINLVDKDVREDLRQGSSTVGEMFEHIYWKKGAMVESTQEKTLTLKQFELKYSHELTEIAKNSVERNLWKKFEWLKSIGANLEKLTAAYRQLDLNVNVNWPLQHYKTAAAYLVKQPSDIRATGGTNWQKYLPPRFQKRIFYPELWTVREMEEWGKPWVENVINEIREK